MQDAKTAQDAARAAAKADAKAANAARKRRKAPKNARTLSTGKRGRPVALYVLARIPTVEMAERMLQFVQEQGKAASASYAAKVKDATDPDLREFFQLKADNAARDWNDTATALKAAISATREKLAEVSK